jgi:alcohol dehydrogenase class IV
MRFEFATATRIIFGTGTLREIGPVARDFGTRALVVTGGNLERAKGLVALLGLHGVAPTIFNVRGEPDTTLISEGVEAAKSAGCTMVIGFGGGSVVDAAKAIAGMMTNEGRILDYLEVVGGGRPLMNPGVPFIAIPTTAGTGAEVTRNAVLTAKEHRVKVSLRSPHLLARVALVDPELAVSLSPEHTAATGMDALSQLIESYVSSRANPMTDALCEQGIRAVARSLEKVYKDGRDLTARKDMALAAMLSGMALANSGLGAVHAFAAPIGGMFDAPHGAVCAVLLPYVWKTNLQAVKSLGIASLTTKFARVGHLLTGRREATGDDAFAWLNVICERLRIPSLATYGVEARHFPEIIERAQRSSSMKGNPAELTPAEMETILRLAVQ